MTRFSAIFLTVCLMPAIAVGQTRELSATGQLLDGIAAVVNEGVVLKSELVEQLAVISKRIAEQGVEAPPQNVLVQQVLERLVLQRIQLQRAERIGMAIPDEMLNRALANVAARNNATLSELPNVLAAEGVDYAVYREQMRRDLTIEQLRQRDVIARISVTPSELDNYMQQQSGRAYINQEFDLSHILVSVSRTATQDQVAAAEAKAMGVYQRAQAGADFAQLAIANSDGQQALNGGSLGWRRGEELPTLFVEIVPGMQAGDISEPLRNASGFHIVKVNDLRGGDPVMEEQINARHILIQTNEILDDDAARTRLEGIRNQIVTGGDFSAIAKAVSEDAGSAIDGGNLGWSNPEAFVPEFTAVAEKLEIGELSQPFQSPFGWHILEVLGRRVQDMTDEVERQGAIMAIRTSKLEEETELWMRRLRDEAFVEYRL
jgi:peptidyl-prolyl cis-trans isomerase SurA